MKYNKLYSGFRSQKKEIFTNEIMLLDKKNGNLLASDILYTFIDLIDEDIIKIEDITKIYKLDTLSNRGTPFTITEWTLETRRYLTYEINVRVKIINKNEIKKYVDFREGFFQVIMRDVYKHNILNRDCVEPYYHLKNIDGRRTYRLDSFENGYVYDNFDLRPKFIEFVDK